MTARVAAELPPPWFKQISTVEPYSLLATLAPCMHKYVYNCIQYPHVYCIVKCRYIRVSIIYETLCAGWGHFCISLFSSNGRFRFSQRSHGDSFCLAQQR